MRCASRATFAIVLSIASSASATPAEDAFKKGRDMMKAGKFAEACAAFTESQKLDPSLGTQFNIAQCQEKTGKLASALKIYRDLAQYDTNETRKAAAATLADKLEPRVPKLAVKVTPAAGAKVTLDGVDCPTCLAGPTPVDIGTIVVAVTATGFKPASQSVKVVEEGKTVAVDITLVPDAQATPATTPPPPPTAISVPPSGPYAMPVNREVRRSKKKLVGQLAVVTGGAVVVTGVVFGVLAKSRWDDAKDVCGGSTACPNQADTDYAQELGDSARTRANVATGLVIGGAAIAAVGAYLWITAPKERVVEIGAAPTTGGGTFVVSGRF